MKIILQGGKIHVPTMKGTFEKENSQMQSVICEVAEGLITKLTNTKELADQIEEVFISKAEFEYTFKTKGSDDLKQLTVNHHDVPELLTVIVELDDDGHIKNMGNNEFTSLYSKEMVAMMTGEKVNDFKPIESHLPKEAVLYDTLSIADFKLKVFYDEANPSIIWKQYYQKKKLIQEVKITLKDNQTIQDVIEEYKKLITL